jgi:type IV pilus assembly protein PilB
MPKQIGEILVDRGLISSDQLQEALKEQRITKEFIGRILVRRGYVREDSLLETLSEQFGIPYLNIKDRYINLAVVRKFPYSFILKHKCFPLEQNGSSVTVAVTNPLDAVAMGEMQKAVNPLKLEIVLTSRDDMAEVIRRYRQYRNRFIRGLIGKAGK